MAIKRTEYPFLLEGLFEDMVANILQRNNLIEIERRTIDEVRKIEKDCTIISGCNRRGLGGSNLAEKFKSIDKPIIIICIIDGHSNYLRGNKIFASSITRILLNRHIASYLYNGLQNSIETFSYDFNSAPIEKPQSNESSVVKLISLGKFVEFSTRSMELLKSMSLRAIGSTTVTLREIAQEMIDVYIRKTKIWNFLWSLPLQYKGKLAIKDLSNSSCVTESLFRYLEQPERSVNIAAASDFQKLVLLQPVINDLFFSKGH